METFTKLVKTTETILMIIGWLVYILFWLLLFYTIFFALTGGFHAIKYRINLQRQHPDDADVYVPQVPTEEHPTSDIKVDPAYPLNSSTPL